VAPLSPVGGQVIDGISLSSNLDAGEYGGALVDAIGFIPIGGNALKGLIRGRTIAKAFRAADDALAAARTGMARATEFAKRRLAASEYWQAIQRRRQAILDKYPNCRRGKCAADRDKELQAQSNLPARENGDWVDANGNRVPAETGRFVPKEGTPLHTALSRHQSPVTGITYTNGQPDLSGFPPLGPGGAAPGGGAYSVEIEQAIGPNQAANADADRNASWGAWRESHGAAGNRDPCGGNWHHTGDGVTMQYVDEHVHGALSHQGAGSMNTNVDF
jgi:DNase/tRNase domain of colicin-like bacteriocin